MKQRLPGIKKIGVIDLANLPANLVMKAKSNVKVSITSNVTEVPIVGTPRCTVNKSHDAKFPKEEVNLTFYSTEIIPKVNKKAFIIVSANYETFVIGDKNWVLPEVKSDFDTGEPSGNPSRYEYKVKWVADVALIPAQVSSI
ncbi:MAG: hypothetical protein IKR05_08490 [Prevotella sp.]|nr:hypothetical protein [Prevotella sp.]